MKLLAKIISVAMALSVSVGIFAGCGQKSIDTENYLEVYVWDAGYGTAWLDAQLEDFISQDWVQEKYPDCDYGLRFNDDNSFAAGRIAQGSTNTIDLFFAGDMQGTFESYAYDLTEVLYEQQVPGEDILYKDKMIDTMYDAMAHHSDTGEVRYYSTPYMFGMISYIYNVTLFEDLGLTVPNTTDDLVELCEKVKGMEGKNPAYPYKHTIISSKIGYSNRLFDLFWAQYDGIDGVSNYFNAIAPDGTRNSVDIFKEKGREVSAHVYENLYKESLGYFDRSSITYEFMAGQTRMLTGEGLIMCCGEWFSNEMAELAEAYVERGYDYEIGMMRPPIVSEIIDKTPSIKNNGGDKKLSEVIDDIDAGRTAPTDPAVTQEDFDLIRKARGVMVCPDAINATAVVAKDATARDMAVDFLLYQATDRANSIYAENTSGGMQAFKFVLKDDDPELYEKMMNESRNTFRMQADASEITHGDNTEIVYGYYPLVEYGNFTAIESTGLESLFMSDESATAADIIAEHDNYWLENNAKRFHNALQRAGLE